MSTAKKLSFIDKHHYKKTVRKNYLQLWFRRSRYTSFNSHFMANTFLQQISSPIWTTTSVQAETKDERNGRKGPHAWNQITFFPLTTLALF